MKKDSLGNRMKENYEKRYKIKLTRRVPVIIRLDGKAFHTLTRNCKKPFDETLRNAMKLTAVFLMNEIQGAKCSYVQSDEISILLTDFDRLTTDAWFDYDLQKIVSVSAGMASACFSDIWLGLDKIKFGIFDSRAFNIPKEEVCNYFIWRQHDWFRNSLQMLCQHHFSHKELQNKNKKMMHDMLHKIGINWSNLPPENKNGLFIKDNEEGILKLYYDTIFTKDRDIIEQFMTPIED